MLRVGLTGGIGSGKSTVAAHLRELGAGVVDADQIAREIVAPGEATLAQLTERFGPQILQPDGSLDRAGLAALVFTDQGALAALNEITGPAILARARAQRAASPVGGVSVFDFPLLVERDTWRTEHLSVVVETPVEIRVERLVTHRGLSEHDARNRIANQATDAARREACDVVIDNGGDVQATRSAVGALWRERLAPAARSIALGIAARHPLEGVRVNEPGQVRYAEPAQLRRVTLRLAAGGVHARPKPGPQPADQLLVSAQPGRGDDLAGLLAELAYFSADGLTYASADPGNPVRLRHSQVG